MRKKYFSDDPNPSFKEDIDKFAYIYKYCVLHVEYLTSLLTDLLDTSMVLEPLFKSKDLHFISLGSGPGTEVLALKRFLHQSGINDKKIKFSLYDIEDSWKDISLVNDPNFEVVYKNFDATKKNEVDIDGVSMIMMVKFASSVFEKAGTNDMFDDLFTQCSNEQLVLFVDNDEEALIDWYKQKLKDNHLKVLAEDNCSYQLASVKRKPFDDFIGKFGHYYPSCQGKFCYILARKK